MANNKKLNKTQTQTQAPPTAQRADTAVKTTNMLKRFGGKFKKAFSKEGKHVRLHLFPKFLGSKRERRSF